MHTLALCRKIIYYLAVRWAPGGVQNSVRCTAAIAFAIFPVTWKHGSWWQVPSQWCWWGGADAQHPRAQRKVKLKTPCVEILTSCNFWNQAKWRDLEPHPYNRPYIWSTPTTCYGHREDSGSPHATSYHSNDVCCRTGACESKPLMQIIWEKETSSVFAIRCSEKRFSWLNFLFHLPMGWGTGWHRIRKNITKRYKKKIMCKFLSPRGWGEGCYTWCMYTHMHIYLHRKCWFNSRFLFHLATFVYNSPIF